MCFSFVDPHHLHERFDKHGKRDGKCFIFTVILMENAKYNININCIVYIYVTIQLTMYSNFEWKI